MIRKKLAGILAAVMVATTIFGNSGIVVNATTLENVDVVTTATAVKPEIPEDTEKPDDNTVESIILENGTYTVTNKTLKENSDKDSSIRAYIENQSIVTVKDGKVIVTMKYTEEALVETIKSTNYITIDGENVEFTKNEDGSISFEVASLEVLNSKIVVNLTYYHPGLPEQYFPGHIHAVSIDLLHEGDFTKVEENDSEEATLENGIYEITNKTLKENSDKDSSIRAYIENKSIVTVEDGKFIVTMKYTEEALVETIKSTNYITIDGQEVEFTKNEDGSISFEIKSLEVLNSKIVVNLTYYHPGLPEQYFPGHMHSVSIDLLHEGELVKIENDNVGTPEIPDNDNSENEDVDGNTGATQKPSEGEGSGSGSGSESGSESEEVEVEKTYTGKNEIVSDSEIGKSMARDAISEDMKIEKIGEKYLATIRFTEFGAEQMSDVIISVNGKEVETKNVRTALSSVSFELESLEDTIDISVAIKGMGGRRISFGLKVLADTLVEVENEGTTGGTTEDSTGGTTGGTSTESNEGTTNDSTQGTVGGSSSDSTTEEVEVVTVKVYSIENYVTHENETGVAMAEMYSSRISKVEEIEGQYYVTLTFTGSKYMQNHEVYVNGNKVSVSKSTSGDETYVRFAVGSLNDSITVSAYVDPMKRNVEFGVVLLPNTLTLIDEYTVEKLPNTGAATSSVAVAGLGLILSSAGVVLAKKRK